LAVCFGGVDRHLRRLKPADAAEIEQALAGRGPGIEHIEGSHHGRNLKPWQRGAQLEAESRQVAVQIFFSDGSFYVGQQSGPGLRRSQPCLPQGLLRKLDPRASFGRERDLDGALEAEPHRAAIPDRLCLRQAGERRYSQQQQLDRNRRPAHLRFLLTFTGAQNPALRKSMSRRSVVCQSGVGQAPLEINSSPWSPRRVCAMAPTAKYMRQNSSSLGTSGKARCKAE